MSMRLSLRLIAAALFCAFAASCSTMLAYEEQRLAKRGLKPSPSPAASAPTGTLLQPNLPKPKVDEAAIQAEKSVEKAEQALADSDPTKTSGVAAGPIIPALKTLLTGKQDIESVSKSYVAYAQAVAGVRVSLEAHGLAANLAGLRQVREAGEYWRLYLPQMRIRPTGLEVQRSDLTALWATFTASGRLLQENLQAINRYIDGQRTKVWSVSNPSK
jgi:hypothetical protein